MNSLTMATLAIALALYMQREEDSTLLELALVFFWACLVLALIFSPVK